MSVNRIRENVNPAELVLDPDNANRGTEWGEARLRTSMEVSGPGRSIALDRNNGVIAGNKTVAMAVEMGIPVTIVESYGEALIAHKRLDLDLNDPTGPARKMAFYDNLVTEQREWEADMLVKYHHSGAIDLTRHFNMGQLRDMGIDVDDLPNPWAGNAGERRRYIPAMPEGYLQEGAARITFPGQRFRCGNHVLTVGRDTMTGEAAVMIHAWEVFTGQRAEPIEDEE